VNPNNLEALLAQIMPVLSNPNAFYSFLEQAPLSREEKEVIRQFYRQLSNPQSHKDSTQSLNQVIQDLIARTNPAHLKNLAPVLDQLSRLSPEQQKALQMLLGIKS
jgi:hypothetical protein